MATPSPTPAGEYTPEDYDPSGVVETLHSYPHWQSTDEFGVNNEYTAAVRAIFLLTLICGFILLIVQWIAMFRMCDCERDCGEGYGDACGECGSPGCCNTERCCKTTISYSATSKMHPTSPSNSDNASQQGRTFDQALAQSQRSNASSQNSSRGKSSSKHDGKGKDEKKKKANVHGTVCYCCKACVCKTVVYRVILGFAFLWLLVGTGLSYWGRNRFQQGANKMADVADFLSDLFFDLQDGSGELIDYSNDMNAEALNCSSTSVNYLLLNATFDLQTYSGDSHDMLRNIASNILDLRQLFDKELPNYIDIGIGCLSAIITLTVYFGWYHAAFGTAHSQSHMLALSSVVLIIFCPLIAFEVTLSVVIADFCYGLDDSIIEVSERYTPDRSQALVEYYITCNGTNPLESALNSTISAIDTIRTAGATHAGTCNASVLENMVSLANKANVTAYDMLGISSCSDVNPSVDTILHDVVCEDAVKGVYYLWAVQLSCALSLWVLLFIVQCQIETMKIENSQALLLQERHLGFKQSHFSRRLTRTERRRREQEEHQELLASAHDVERGGHQQQHPHAAAGHTAQPGGQAQRNKAKSPTGKKNKKYGLSAYEDEDARIRRASHRDIHAAAHLRKPSAILRPVWTASNSPAARAHHHRPMATLAESPEEEDERNPLKALQARASNSGPPSRLADPNLANDREAMAAIRQNTLDTISTGRQAALGQLAKRASNEQQRMAAQHQTRAAQAQAMKPTSPQAKKKPGVPPLVMPKELVPGPAPASSSHHHHHAGKPKSPQATVASPSNSSTKSHHGKDKQQKTKSPRNKSKQQQQHGGHGRTGGGGDSPTKQRTHSPGKVSSPHHVSSASTSPSHGRPKSPRSKSPNSAGVTSARTGKKSGAAAGRQHHGKKSGGGGGAGGRGQGHHHQQQQQQHRRQLRDDDDHQGGVVEV